MYDRKFEDEKKQITFSFVMEPIQVSKSSDKNSFGFLTFQPGLLLNNLK